MLQPAAAVRHEPHRSRTQHPFRVKPLIEYRRALVVCPTDFSYRRAPGGAAPCPSKDQRAGRDACERNPLASTDAVRASPYLPELVQHQYRLRPMRSVVSISKALRHSGGPRSAREDHSPLGVERDLRGLARSKLFGQGPAKVGGEVYPGAVTRQAHLLHLAAVARVEANAA